MASIKRPTKKQLEKVIREAASQKILDRAKYEYVKSYTPPDSNTGGNSDNPPIDNHGLKIDTLSITGKFDDIQSRKSFTDKDYVNEFMVLIQMFLGFTVNYSCAGSKNGYRTSRTLEYTDGRPFKNLGFVAWGGNAGTYQLYLTGEACEYLGLNNLFPKLKNIVDLNIMKIKRIDIAHDDYEGTFNLQTALDMYDNDLFTIRRKPSIRQVGDWHNEHDTKGRTVYIGNRNNGKMMRVYEKGKQLGDEKSSWVRWEVELKAIDRTIPTDILTNYAPYFTGSYPALKSLCKAKAIEIATVCRKKVEITIQKMIEWISNSGGKTLYAIRQLKKHLGLENDTQILDMLTRGKEELPKRLVFPVKSVSVSPVVDVLENAIPNDTIHLQMEYEK
jgi:phage replication initiation protein